MRAKAAANASAQFAPGPRTTRGAGEEPSLQLVSPWLHISTTTRSSLTPTVMRGLWKKLYSRISVAGPKWSFAGSLHVQAPGQAVAEYWVRVNFVKSLLAKWHVQLQARLFEVIVPAQERL